MNNLNTSSTATHLSPKEAARRKAGGRILTRLNSMRDFFTKECFCKKATEAQRERATQLLTNLQSAIERAGPQLPCADLGMDEEDIALECLLSDPNTLAAALQVEELLGDVRHRISGNFNLQELTRVAA